MINQFESDPGSFRDPRGRVYLANDKVYRTVMPCASDDYEFFCDSGLLTNLIEARKLVPAITVNPGILGELAPDAKYVLEHPKIPFISYPYEWSFATLKAAALLHLDIHMQALALGVNLSDATAYNVQFQGPNPVFIDHLSFGKYRDGEFWTGHGQFCEQFLNPLLLRSTCGVAHNAWYRGGLVGIPVSELNRLIPWNGKLTWNKFFHITAQAWLQNRAVSRQKVSMATKRHFPITAFNRILSGLYKWIAKLQPADTGRTTWRDYAKQHSYTDEEVRRKEAFVHAFAAANNPNVILDIGCNTGNYSKIALDSGVNTAIGFDFDQGAVELAFSRAQAENLNFLPLILDASNPSPSQGWAETERPGLKGRANADGLLALAIVHHLAIGKNVPLDQVVDWIISLAPKGVIEFVPKQDAMVQELLRLREDVFFDYSEEQFLRHVSSRARLVRQDKVSRSGRLLVWYERNSDDLRAEYPRSDES